MKNLMLYIVEDRRRSLDDIRRELDLQVANSLDLGWAGKDIILLTNFPYIHRGVQAIQFPAQKRPPTARITSFHKTCCILSVLDRIDASETIWYHDVDAFQLSPMTEPPSRSHLAFCLYSTRERMLVQGGSLFFSRAALPIFEEVFNLLVNHRCRKDEFALTDITGLSEFAGSFEVLDYSYNLGGTDFELRYQLADKPIKVIHFHLGDPEHEALFLHARNSLGVSPVDERFRELLASYGFAVDEPSPAASNPSGKLPQYHSTSPLVNQLRRVFSWTN